MKIVRFILSLLFLTLVLTGNQAGAIKATIDPSELAVGSRPLGLGRAYVGLANDVYSIFQNCAGLTRIKDWQFASMYSNVIQEVDYSLLGLAKSLSREAVGAAYLKASVSGSRFTKRDPVTDRIVPEGEGAMGYESSVWFLSYALELGKYLPQPIFKKVSLSTSLKIFNQSLTGLPTRDVYAMGNDLDVGLQYRPNSWLTLGLAGYNVLPYDMGGRLVWASGITESIPASAKVGAAVKLLGSGGMREQVFFPQELFLSYDYEFALTQKRRPGASHLGLEWRPFEILSLRLGLDQDVVAVSETEIGIDNNLSAGIGLTLSNFRFDYAFHTFGVLSANNTHFISVTYGIEREKLPAYAPPKPKEYIEILEPAKKSITFLSTVIVKGMARNMKEIKEVRVNQTAADVFADASFISVVKLPRYGMNTIEVSAISTTGRILETKKIVVVRLVSFADIKEGHPLRIKVGAMAALGYISGYKDGTFRPQGKITRAELCTLLVRIGATEEVKIPRRPPFKDVPLRHWAAGYIGEAARQNLVRGYPDKTFRPRNNITRAEAVSIMVNFAPIEKVRYVYEKPFPDVEDSYWAARMIFLAKKHGYLDYLAGKNFRPKLMITRAEVVDILSKIDPVAAKLKELLD